MIRAVKRLILRTIERAGYIVLKRDDRTAWQIGFADSHLQYGHSLSASGSDARIAAQLQVLARELLSAREAATRAERELEKARAKLWELRRVSPQAPCSNAEGFEGSPGSGGEVSSGPRSTALGHATR